MTKKTPWSSSLHDDHPGLGYGYDHSHGHGQHYGHGHRKYHVHGHDTTCSQIVWFTALFPYFVMITLLFRAITLEGAGAGLMLYVTPDW